MRFWRAETGTENSRSSRCGVQNMVFESSTLDVVGSRFQLLRTWLAMEACELSIGTQESQDQIHGKFRPFQVRGSRRSTPFIEMDEGSNRMLLGDR